MEKKTRNRVDIWGYDCRFTRIDVGHRHPWGYDFYCYTVKLNDIFVGVVRIECGNGWNFVCCTPEGDSRNYRGDSRVRAVRAYILDVLYCDSVEG